MVIDLTCLQVCKNKNDVTGQLLEGVEKQPRPPLVLHVAACIYLHPAHTSYLTACTISTSCPPFPSPRNFMSTVRDSSFREQEHYKGKNHERKEQVLEQEEKEGEESLSRGPVCQTRMTCCSVSASDLRASDLLPAVAVF